ncbi:MAG: hypothetical protein M3545_19340, partial [Acidobacteriota bacterium]|nr:hypothetical protein [Acidobacteriota bacterium]
MLSRRELVLLILLFVCSLPAVTPRLYSSDEVQYFSYLRSLWFDRDVSFENEYRYFYDHRIAQSADFHRTFLELETPAGRRINYGTLGSAILWSPFYAVADVVARIARAAGVSVAVDGYSRPYVAAVAYGSAFYGFATIVLGIAAARRLLGAAALSDGLAVWAGTPILFYMYVAPPFSHACSAFAVALLVTVWLHVRQTWTVRGAVALGLSGALVAMVREQDALFVVAPALDYVVGHRAPLWRQRAADSRILIRLVAPAAAGCAAFVLGYLPQLLAYQALNGRPRPSELVTRKMNWAAPHALQVLASPEHGFFFWTPLAVLCLAGLVVAAILRRRLGTPESGLGLTAEALRGPGAKAGAGDPGITTDRRRVAACMLLMVALQVYVSGAVESWTVAGAFGQRRFVSVTVLLVIGLAALREAIPARAPRMLLHVAVGVAIWWNVALMAAFATRMMDRQRLEPRRNAYDAFVTLPRLAPALIYK